MRTVVFDVRANHDTGVSRYGLSLLAAIAPLTAKAGVRLIVVASPVQEVRARVATVESGETVVVCPEAEGFVRRSQWVRDLLVERNAELYFTSHYTVDRLCPVPFVFTIHDLTRLRFPALAYSDASFAERFGAAELVLLRDELAELGSWGRPYRTGSLFTRYFWALNRHLADRAERVITVSRSTENDIRSLLAVEPARLDMVPCAVDTAVFHRRDEAAVQAVGKAHDPTGPYLIFVGLAHPNKRLPWLVEALLRVRHRFPATARLVVVGGHAEQVPAVHELLRRYRAQDFVVFTGRVTDTELAALYSGAAALVTASLNEGNNLPPLEAMACGSQVIATDIAPLRESLGRSASFYDPDDGGELGVLAEAALGGRLPDLAHSFRPPMWSDSARALLDALVRATRTTG